MRLADFILMNMEAIVVEWEEFAASLLPAAEGMSSLALRDHAVQILQAVATDMSTYQSRQQQLDKSQGLAEPAFDASETAAQTHAVLRARSGFDIKQLAAEYRALRTSVLRQWSEKFPDSPRTGFYDVIRFNEAIDQALAESISFFSDRVEQSRNLLLGVLGHDLRNPLQTIHVTATYLSALNAGANISQAAGRLIESGKRMRALLDDLLDFNRTQLGLGLPMSPAKTDLAALVTEEVDQFRAAYPHRKIELELSGEMSGVWDANRLRQLIGNLIANALKHGARDAAVKVRASANASEVRIDVKNRGPEIEAKDRAQIFQPLRRGPARTDQAEPDHGLGLGLYIASEVVRGHGGRIEVTSDERETVFTVYLPRFRSNDAT